jgi:hypothetical protein
MKTWALLACWFIGVLAFGGWQIEDSALAEGPKLRLVVKDSDGKDLAARVTMRAGDNWLDGAGKGIYADGRFFIDGDCEVRCEPGEVSISVSCGPEYKPLATTVELKAGRMVTAIATFKAWAAPGARGWYCGDNHVHAQHDAKAAAVCTDLAYSALQARANGLDYMTEAGSHVSYLGMIALNRKDFLFRYADELRPAIFSGHVTTPGIRDVVPKDVYERLRKLPLPVQALLPVVHELGGIVTHTHVQVPRHQLHWMGAAELWCDAVHRRCADAVDLDGQSSELLYFAMLNLGNRSAVSGYTDAALGRSKTLAPGDRRVYSQADRFDYDEIVDGIRKGRTFATNGGPLFAYLTVNGQVLGSTVDCGASGQFTAEVEVQSLKPLDWIDLVHNGVVAARVPVKGKTGTIRQQLSLNTTGQPHNWVLLRARDQAGNWAITSPVYLHRSGTTPRANGVSACVLAEINNTRRTYRLSKRFFMHALTSVSPELSLSKVELLRDGAVLKRFTAGERSSKVVAVTPFGEDYAPGVSWVERDGRYVHCQFDWAVTESGWYQVALQTVDGKRLAADAVYFDASHPVSHELSSARMVGPETELFLHGYGEEMPLADIRDDDKGDHWWYPANTYSHMGANFHGEAIAVGPWGKEPERRFRNSKNSSEGF